MTEAAEERFVVTDDKSADWCIRKIIEEDQELERLNAWYDRQKKAAKEQHDFRVAYFTGLLEDYFRDVPAKETKTQRKYSLPSGDMVQTKDKADFSVEDEAKLLKWCEDNDPDLVKVVTSPKWGDLKKRLESVEGMIVDHDTGLFVDGVKIETKPGEFKVKVRAD